MGEVNNIFFTEMRNIINDFHLFFNEEVFNAICDINEYDFSHVGNSFECLKEIGMSRKEYISQLYNDICYDYRMQKENANYCRTNINYSVPERFKHHYLSLQFQNNNSDSSSEVIESPSDDDENNAN